MSVEVNLQFTNCRVLRDGKLVKDDIWVTGGKIVDGQQWFYATKAKATRVIDCKGKILAPGFIDVQINGGYGTDFSNCADEFGLRKGVAKVAKKLLSTGTTMFCPTIISSSKEAYTQLIPQIEAGPGGPDGAAVIGLHLEGPFIAAGKKGAHPARHITCCQEMFEPMEPVHPESDVADSAPGPTSDERMARAKKYLLETYSSLSGLSIVTIAPELPYAAEMISILSQAGVRVSLGHSQSNLAQAEAGVNAGGSMVTHMFNAMTAFHHRDPGIIGLLGSTKVDKRPFYGLIVDGFHTHESAIRIAHTTHPDGCILVTDAMAAMGLGAGVHTLGDVKVNIDAENKATVDGFPEVLAGSAITMDASVQRLAQIIGVCAALEAASLHPAQALGLDGSKGRLEADHDADIVMLDDDLKLHATYIAGELCWSSDDHKAAWFYAPQAISPVTLDASPTLKGLSRVSSPLRAPGRTPGR